MHQSLFQSAQELDERGVKNMSRYSYWGFKPQPTVWERQQKAAKTIARMRKKGANLSPVQLEGRMIAKTFWGKAWCDNIESYRDFAYRLERGRSYVRSGAVIDLRISEGAVGALVIGSGRSPYEVVIRIDKMKKSDWDALVKRSSGKIASLMALAQGKLPKEMLEDFCNPETGLFSKLREIHFDCSCPDGASCCKHVAAVLYGVGARLDEQPELFFTLRGIDPNSIVSAEVVDALTDGASSELEGADLGDVFGIELDGDNGHAGRVTLPAGGSQLVATENADAMNCVPPVSGLAARVKALRLRLGLSQSAFGKKIGTYQAVVSLMERGKGDSQIRSHMSAIERLEKSVNAADNRCVLDHVQRAEDRLVRRRGDPRPGREGRRTPDGRRQFVSD
jgi:transcriptional regulator with XRE-family HTH domain